MGQDLRYALRVLRKSPLFALTAIGILALGIGANSAMFSLVYSVLLRPLPYQQPDRIAVILGASPRREGTFSLPPADYLDLREQSRAFSAMAAAELWSPSLTGEGEAEELPGMRATTALFDVFGVKAALGRTFEPRDEQPDAPRVAVIGAGLWKRRFGGDPSVIGRTVLLSRERYTIAGVLPEGFYFPPFWAGRTEIYTPLLFPPAKTHDRQMSTLRVFARLAPASTWEQARSEVLGIARRLAAQYPKSNAEKDAVAIPVAEISTGKVRSSLIVLLGAVACILLIACANLANLSLARATGRTKELAIRQAMGAGQLALIRQMLTESLVVAAVGGALGLLLAAWAVRAFLTSIPGAGAFPRQAEVEIGWQVALFNLGLCLITGIGFGLVPALRATRQDLNHGLKQAVRGTTGDRAGLRIRGLLVGAEVAIALILLAGAGLLVASFRNLRSIDAGFDSRHLLAVSTAVSGSDHASGDRRAAFYRQAVERLRRTPGVTSASAVNHAPMVGDMWQLNITVEGQPAPRPGNEPSAVYRVAMPGYFQAMGMRLERGRDFEPTDREGAPLVAVVNQTMARRLWPGQDAIGKRFRVNSSDNGAAWLTVTGILRDTRQWTWSDSTQNEMFLPFEQDPAYLHSRAGFLTMMFVVRTAPEPAAVAASIRGQLRELDSAVPVTAIQNMEQVANDALWQQRMEMSVLTGFAGLALVLAVLGIYAVMSFVVGGRTQEIGIRMALGAARADVLLMVLRQSLRPVAIGLAAGLAGAALLTRAMGKMLYGIQPADPAVLALAATLLALVAAAAAWLPAQRAAKVDPLTALRQD